MMRKVVLGFNIARRASLLSRKFNQTQVVSLSSTSQSLFFGKKEENKTETKEKKAEETPDEEPEEMTLEKALEQINDLKVSLEESAAKIEKIEKEKKDQNYRIATLTDEYKSQGERLQREAEKAKIFGIKKFAKSLLPVADQLILAMDNFPVEEGNEKLSEFKDGIKMTQDELSRALEKNNIVLVNPNIGDVFDPEIHEAVMKVSRNTMPDAEPNTIAFVQKTGYNIKDQVLRPCWVGVIAE